MSIIKLPCNVNLELTYRCNHRCIFCSCPWEAEQTYREDELTLKQWRDAIKLLYDNGVNSFALTGGEPLMREDLCDIIDTIYQYGAGIVVISNGKKMDNELLSYLAERKVTLCISVPGIHTFEEQTGTDNISHVLSLFEKAKSMGLHTSANIAVTKKNLPELYENIALPLIHGADYILLNRFLPGGRGLDNTEFLLSPKETNKMLEIAETVLRKANRRGHVGTELPLCAIENAEQYQHLQVSSLCAAAKGFFIVDPSGYIKVCNHSPEKICRYTELADLTQSSYWKIFAERNYIPEMCIDCDKQDICDGGCREAAHVYHGRINAPDPLFAASLP